VKAGWVDSGVWMEKSLPKVKVSAGTFASYTPKAYAKSLSQTHLEKTA
jgi:hypothetical protein